MVPAAAAAAAAAAVRVSARGTNPAVVVLGLGRRRLVAAKGGPEGGARPGQRRRHPHPHRLRRHAFGGSDRVSLLLLLPAVLLLLLLLLLLGDGVAEEVFPLERVRRRVGALLRLLPRLLLRPELLRLFKQGARLRPAAAAAATAVLAVVVAVRPRIGEGALMLAAALTPVRRHSVMALRRRKAGQPVRGRHHLLLLPLPLLLLLLATAAAAGNLVAVIKRVPPVAPGRFAGALT